GLKASPRAEAPYHSELFESLKQLRRDWAEQSKLPPFVIFHDETLKSISRTLPVTLADLRHIKGVGRHKLESYGVALTNLVKQFLERRPESRPFASISVKNGAPESRRV